MEIYNSYCSDTYCEGSPPNLLQRICINYRCSYLKPFNSYILLSHSCCSACHRMAYGGTTGPFRHPAWSLAWYPNLSTQWIVYLTAFTPLQLPKLSPNMSYIDFCIDTFHGYGCYMKTIDCQNQAYQYRKWPNMIISSPTVRLTDVRKSGELWWLRPDGKTQVTIEYLDWVGWSVIGDA